MKVPTYDTPQVAPQQGSAPYDQGINPRTLAEGAAGPRENIALGSSLLNAGAQMNAEQAQAQAIANQTRVDDALNQVRAKQFELTYGTGDDPASGFSSQKGKAALDPDPLGRSLPQRYGEQLQDTIGTVASSLGNDVQRQQFQQSAANLATQFQGSVQQHMASEYRSLALSTQEGTQQLATQAAFKLWDHPDDVDAQIDSLKAAIYKAGMVSGQSANQITANMNQSVSTIHAGVINAALQNNNPQYAMDYLAKNKDAMGENDLLRAHATVDQDVKARIATSAATTAISAIKAQTQPSDITRMTQITAQAESGGRETNPDGSTVTSPKGAQGVMQVMPATNRDPGFGVRPAQDDSPGERARVGRDYLTAMVKRYGGDPAKAWAAYNGGPGTVDNAVAAAHGGNWLAAMPQETQKYVASNVAALQKSQTTAPPVVSIADVHNSIRTQLQSAPPDTLKAALAEGTRQFADYIADQKAQADGAVTAAQQWLVQNKGNFPALPPDMKQNILTNAPDQWVKLQDFGKAVGTPPQVTNRAAYLDAVAHPEDLAKMPDSVFNHFAMTNFDPADSKQIAKMRQDELSGKEDMSAGGLNRAALNQLLNNRLTSIGINPAPKDLPGKQQVGSIQKFVTDGIFQQQQQLGRKMSAQEQSDYLDQQFAKNINFRSTFLGIDMGAAPINMMSMKVSDIPSDSLNQVKQALAAAGNTKPTEDQIMRTWWTAKNKNAR